MKLPHALSLRRPLRKGLQGLTLIELMIAISIGAILIALAAPSFKEALGKNRLSSAASEFTGAVQLARAEAIRNNRRVTLCRSEDGSSCNSTDTVWPGWIVFVDLDGDGVRDNNEPVVKAGTFDGNLRGIPSANITTANQRITFRGDGIARTNGQQLLTGTLALCLATTEPADNVRDVSLAFGSRTVVRKRNGSGACNTPADTL